ncbi:MAG: UDP-N-acetylmuramoyl-L-alanyl-D-glutamate--2,6-diaminopimelate ligase [Brevinematia bacterium]
MRLSKLLSLIREYVTYENISKDIEITDLCEDSRYSEINQNTLFFAIEGSKVDATKFIPELIERGCRTFIASKPVEISDKNINIVVVNNIRRVQAIVSKHFFGKPDEKLKVLGVTGTKGKTTISYMIFNALRGIGMKGGLIGTIEYKIDDSSIPAENTTPGPLQIYTLLSDIVNNSGEFVSMEVSSHGLETERVYGVKFDVGVFTNLSREHLDFHKDMESYFNAKMKLFHNIKLHNPEGTAVINIDTEWGNRAYEIAKNLGLRTITCSIKNTADIIARDITISIDGNRFTIECNGKSYKAKTKMAGLHNVYNAICSLGAVLSVADENKIPEVIEHIGETTVKGRFQVIKSNRGFFVAIDYAHTPDSLEKTLETGRTFSPTRLTVVFGAGGDRDRGKRPLMGEVAVKLADKVIITSDNPRTENPTNIIMDILSGISEDGMRKVKVIEDRRKAINTALKEAIEGELIIIAGKGHEEYQIIGTQKLHFSDIEEVTKSEYF